MGEGWCNSPGGYSVGQMSSTFPDMAPVQGVLTGVCNPKPSKQGVQASQASRSSFVLTTPANVNQTGEPQLGDDTEKIDSFCAFLVENHGSMIKAWRRILDPHHDGELLFSEFVEALARASWHGDAPALWAALVRKSRAHRGLFAVGLREVAPTEASNLEAFQQWTLDNFGGPIDMLNNLSSKPNPSLSTEEFVQACQDYNFYSGDAHCILQYLDLDGSGSVTVADVAFLEPNALKRKRALDPGVMMSLDAAKAAAKKLRRRLKLQRRTRDLSLKEFRKQVRSAAGGSFIRGWRRILDLDGNMTISKAELWKGCRKIAFHGDVAALWKAMDVDDDGSVHLQEVDARMALVLARFKKWATDNHGSCVTSIQYLAALIKKRTPKWTVDEFLNALRMANFPPIVGVSLVKAAPMLHQAGDLMDVGYIVRDDYMFLDKWEPAPFLCASPDLMEKDRFLHALQCRYASLIVGWRRILDKDNKNRVSYKDFSDACRLMHFNDNVPGLWCALDEDASGFISLDEIDHESADVLLAFKEWAELNFGTIPYAYKMLDTTRSNAMSFPMFKRSMRDFGYEGDARSLFLILKPEANMPHRGRDVRLMLEDIKYLSTWEPPEQYQTPDSSDEEGDDDELQGSFEASQTSPLEEDKCTFSDGLAQRERMPRSSVTSNRGSLVVRKSDVGLKALLTPCDSMGASPKTSTPEKVERQKPAMYRMSAEFVFCKSPREYKHYQLYSQGERVMKHNFSVSDLLLGEHSPAGFQPRRKSPYHFRLARSKPSSASSLRPTRSAPSLRRPVTR